MAKKKHTPFSARVKKFFHALFVPHAHNQYRPHAARGKGTFIVVALIVAMHLAYSYAAYGTFNILSASSDINVSELLEQTNDNRQRYGLAGLTQSDALTQAAQLKAQDMLANQYWAHTSPSGVTPWKWLSDVGYTYSVAGENLAKNYPDARSAVDAWMNSETHRANILNSRYSEVGFAVADGDIAGEYSVVVVALYARPASADQPVRSGAGTLPSEIAATVNAGTAPLTYFAAALRSLSPVSLVSLGLLTVVGVAAILAHHYRRQWPKSWQKGWRRHHALYTFAGLIFVAVLVVLIAGGGSL